MEISAKNINKKLGGGSFKGSTQFKLGTIQNCLYADDCCSSLCGKQWTDY